MKGQSVKARTYSLRRRVPNAILTCKKGVKPLKDPKNKILFLLVDRHHKVQRLNLRLSHGTMKD